MSHLPRLRTSVLAASLCGSGLVNAAELVLSIGDESTSRPLADTRITVIDREGKQIQVNGNEKGVARADSLAAGLYEVVIQRDGYTSIRLPSVRLIDDKTTPLTIPLTRASGEVEEVLVVGNSIGGRWLSSAGASLRDREALRSAAGSGSDVLRALDGLPGLFSDSQFSSYTVRGSGPRDNLILVDGVPFERVVHFSDSFGELSDAQEGGRYSVFAPNTVAQADFQPGGWSSAYGGRAGSLLQLDVARGNPETASYTARIDIAGLEVGYDGPSKILDNTSILFSARQLNFGRLFETVGLDDIGEPEVTDVIFKSYSELDGGDSIELLAIYAPETFTRDRDNVLASDEDDIGDFEDVELVEQESDNSLMVATYRKLIGSSAQLTNKVYYRHFGEDTQVGEAYPEQAPLGSGAEDVPQRLPIITAKQDDTELGWRLDFSYENSLGRFSAGTRLSQSDLTLQRFIDGPWIRYEYDSDSFRPDPEQNYVVLTSDGVDTDYQVDALQYAAYVDQEFTLGFLDVRAGLRFEGDEFTDENGVSPRLAATWPVTDSASLSATVGRYLQMPRLDDLASNTSGNTLEYEVIDQASLGLNYQLNEQWEVFVEPYYQKLSNLVVQSDTVTQRYNNLGEGTSWGFDTAITREFGNGWSASATYSYNEVRLKDAPNLPEYDADYHRPHSASIGGVWEINQRWKLSGRWKWASGRPYGDYIIHDNVLGDGQPLRYSRETITNNTERFASYSSFNVRIDYQRMLASTQVIAFIDIISLLGEENPSSIDFNERSGEVLAEDGSLLPIVGLRFEW